MSPVGEIICNLAFVLFIIYPSELCIILVPFSSYDLMLQCWKMESSERPTFVEIKEYSEGLIEEKVSKGYYLALPIDPLPEG